MREAPRQAIHAVELYSNCESSFITDFVFYIIFEVKICMIGNEEGQVDEW